jgi:glycosyltransferase involved in cell wall biosynthesis
VRLLVVTSTYPRWHGDPEPAFVHELARRLVDRFEIQVIGPHAPAAATEQTLDGVHVCRYRYAPEAWETLVNAGGILTNLRRAPWKWLLVPGFALGQWLAIRRAIRRFRPQVVHAHWLLPQGLISVCAIGHAPLLATSHGADLFALRGAISSRLRRWVIGRVRALSVVSQGMRERVLAEVPQARVQVMPMGVDCERFRPDQRARADGALLFVGRLVEKKGVRHLIEAMPAVVGACPHAHLMVVGFGPEQTRLELRVAELGLQACVRFLGPLPQDQLPDHYRNASLFVAPFVEADGGDQEGLGLVVAEAMACACPVLVGEVAGVRDLIAGATGVRVDATDHAALAAAIIDLLQDERRRTRLAGQARAHVLRHFAWPVVADGYARLLATLATGS